MDNSTVSANITAVNAGFVRLVMWFYSPCAQKMFCASKIHLGKLQIKHFWGGFFFPFFLYVIVLDEL